MRPYRVRGSNLNGLVGLLEDWHELPMVRRLLLVVTHKGGNHQQRFQVKGTSLQA
jgi:hypothetical protein